MYIVWKVSPVIVDVQRRQNQLNLQLSSASQSFRVFRCKLYTLDKWCNILHFKLCGKTATSHGFSQFLSAA